MEAAVPPELRELPAIPHDHAEQLRERGFCVVKGLLSEALLAEAVRSDCHLPPTAEHRCAVLAADCACLLSSGSLRRRR